MTGMTGMTGEPIRVLVVEDDPVAADAHVMYVGRVPGFVAVGKAHTGAQARRILDRTAVDLLLLDLHLPDVHGLQFARSLRAAGHQADVIAVTSARDLAVVREGVSLGVVQYVLKPFTFATLRDRLTRYAEFRAAAGEASGQDEVDRALAALRAPSPAALPKGLSAPTLERVTVALREAEEGLTAAALAESVGISRITARRYLEHLVEAGRAGRSPFLGGPRHEERLVRCGAGQDGLGDEALHPRGSRHRAAHQRDLPAVGQGHADRGSLCAGDQLGGLFQQDRLVAGAYPGAQVADPDAVVRQGGGLGAGVQVRPQQGALAFGALSEQPPLDGVGRPAYHRGQRRVLGAARVAEAQDALDAAADRVADRNGPAGVALRAFGEVLGAVDLDELPLGQREPDAVGAGVLLGEDEPGDALERREGPGQGRLSEAAQQHGPVRVREGDVHPGVGEPGLQPVQHRLGRADDPGIVLEVLQEGEPGLVGGEPQGPAALPRVPDGDADAGVDCLALQKPLTRTGGPLAVRRTPRRCRFPAAPNHASPHSLPQNPLP